MQLSVIVPVYNVEKYIRPCVESIFRQGLDESFFEIILVDDGTKDDSFKQIDDIVASNNNVKVVKQNNQGLSVARNTGMKHASGEYLLFVDSDDILIDDTLKPLLDCARNSSVDMAMGEFCKLTDEQIDNSVPFPYSDRDPLLMSGKEAFVSFFNPRECYVWRTLYRRSFLIDNSIYFIPGIYFEDIPFTTECYLKAKNCLSLPLLFYIYRQHSNTITSSINKKKLSDFNIVIEYLWNLKRRFSLTGEEAKKLQNTIFSTFSVEMWYLTSKQGLYNYRKDIVEDLKMRVPDLFFLNGVNQLLVSFLFKYIPYSYLWFRTIV